MNMMTVWMCIWMMTLLTFGCVGFGLYRRLNNRLTGHQADIKRLRKENKVILAGAVGVGQRIVDLEKQIHELSFRQEKKIVQKPSTNSYLQASKLAQMGASLEDITESCALSRAEAELVLVLKQKTQAESDLPVVEIE